MNVVVLTGADISAESGVPTFRDAQTGLWEEFDPSQLATAEAFRLDPPFVWAWYAWRMQLVRGVEPNDGHRDTLDGIVWRGSGSRPSASPRRGARLPSRSTGRWREWDSVCGPPCECVPGSTRTASTSCTYTSR